MNCLLLDADVIIDLYRLGLWNGIVVQNNVSVASTVAHVEALHYYDESNTKTYIDLSSEIQNGKITELCATVEDQKAISDKFDPIAGPTVNPGELESIAIIHSGTDANIKFCTCDGPAIIALSMLQLDHRGISFETALRQAGIRTKNILIVKYSEKRFKKLITEGKHNLVSGIGFKK